MEFIETLIFRKVSKDLLSEEDIRQLQALLLLSPAMGLVIPGSGGLRKLRHVFAGKGKSGGLRIIYYWMSVDDKIYLLYVYKKSRQEDLSRDQIKLLRYLVEG